MGEKKVYLFVEESFECFLAESLLKALLIDYEKIRVDESIRGSMLRDFGTTRTPLLVFGDKVLVGLKDIQKFLEEEFHIQVFWLL